MFCKLIKKVFNGWLSETEIVRNMYTVAVSLVLEHVEGGTN